MVCQCENPCVVEADTAVVASGLAVYPPVDAEQLITGQFLSPRLPKMLLGGMFILLLLSL